MNNRIKLLAEQAREKKFDYRAREGESHYIYVLNEEKFAELIVKECIQVSGPEDSYTDEWFKAKVDSVQKIKKHFGVK